MSRKAMRYKIRITPVRVPATLQGVWLPVEIIPSEGEAKESLISLEENRTATKSVKAPGSYQVRAVLPSGQLIAKTIIIPSPTDPKGGAPGDVTLDFSGYVPAAEAQERAVTKDLNKPPFHLGLRFFVQPEPHELRGLERQLIRGVGGGPDVSQLSGSLNYGLFDHWDRKGSSKSSTDTLVTKPCAKDDRRPDSVKLPGHLKMTRHPGWKSSSREWQPLLIRVRFSPPYGFEQEALVVYPPGKPPLPLQLLPVLHPDLNSMAPWLLAYSNNENRELDLMFKYVRGGDLHRARQLVPGMVKRAQDILSSKFKNPVNATLAAYVLLKVSDTKRQDWVYNLANRFTHLPDAAIIYGWYLIRDGKAEQARDYFKTAIGRGLPMYSEGVRLLRDGLNFLSGLYPKDPQVKADAARANRISDLANLDSDLTCLRLGKGLGVKVQVSRS